MSDQRYEGPPCPECDNSEYDAITDRVGECVRCGTAFTITDDSDDSEDADTDSRPSVYGRPDSLVERRTVGR